MVYLICSRRSRHVPGMFQASGTLGTRAVTGIVNIFSSRSTHPPECAHVRRVCYAPAHTHSSRARLRLIAWNNWNALLALRLGLFHLTGTRLERLEQQT